MSQYDLRMPFSPGSVAGMTTAEAERRSPSPQFLDITPEEYALLATIASTESPGYDVIYGGSRFSDFSDHPRQYMQITSGPNKGKKSSAAGRYQFLASTWDRLAKDLGLSDFSPQNQDIAAVKLARDDYKARTGRDLTEDLKSKDPNILAGIGKALAPTWTSLPSGIESAGGADKFVSTFNAAYGGELPQPSAGQKSTGQGGILAALGALSEGDFASLKQDNPTQINPMLAASMAAPPPPQMMQRAMPMQAPQMQQRDYNTELAAFAAQLPWMQYRGRI